MAKPPPLPFRDSSMSAAKPNLTRPRLSRTLGILTILYALGLIGYGVLNLAVVTFLPRLGGLFESLQTEQMSSQVAGRQRALKTLEEAEAQAATPEAKAQIKVDRLLLERTQPSPMPGTSIPGIGMFNDTDTRRGMNIDAGLKLATNVLLLISGIGLFRGTAWARSLTLGTAWLKIAALVILTIVSLRTVVEPMSRSWSVDVEKMMSQALGTAEPPPDAMKLWSGYETAMKSSFSSTIILMAVLGLSYPILLIFLLNRPRIRAELTPAPASTSTGVPLE